MKKIKKILIANRGEIASRIIRTCQKMGITSIAVFSEADRNAPFVAQADLAVFIGESSPSESYLSQEKIIAAAKKTKADAIHPGYGFLSENTLFAKKCKEENIIFIGPNPAAIDAMGSKSHAKKIMEENDVPVIPGYKGEDQSEATLQSEALKIGFPLLLKATAGGGGKGMRIVHQADEIIKAIHAAKREAKNAFGDDELIIEKYISSGRHIEFQIFGDQHGNLIHLLERECTIQRRYQKVIEESPSPIMTEDLRKKMGQAAVLAAKALNYDNAGTVEFIYDDKSGDFFFLEVNTRLQVEHPVTEEITGLDLVKMQIESASGMPLSISQNEVIGNGYAIEARLYAEDAANNFTPVTGKIHQFKIPNVEGLRIETAVQSDSEVSVFYDPMIAKIIVWEKNREAAHDKLAYVLQHLICQGITTNQAFLTNVLAHEDFRKGNYDTHFIEQKMNLDEIDNLKEEDLQEAAIAATIFDWKKRESERTILQNIPSGWRNSFYRPNIEKYIFGEKEIEINYRFSKNQFEFSEGEKTILVRLANFDNKKIRIEIDGIQKDFSVLKVENEFHVQTPSIGNIKLKQVDRFPKKEKEKIKGGYEAPMPSQIISVLVAPNQKIKQGTPLLVISSMKMENTICAEEDGVVEEIYATEGNNVEAGFLLMKIT
ncbi:MAG: biotin carboxylase N-terminal domain-containing protein [Saprospiraceae bacterium]